MEIEAANRIENNNFVQSQNLSAIRPVEPDNFMQSPNLSENNFVQSPILSNEEEELKILGESGSDKLEPSDNFNDDDEPEDDDPE